MHLYYILMSESESEDHSSVANAKPHKLFITGLDGKSELNDLKAQLEKIFSKYGELVSVVPKKSYNHQYSYAFIDFREDVDATLAMKRENNSIVGGAKISVTIQDNLRKRKGTQIYFQSRNDGCFKCGDSGHFARQCPNAPDKNSAKSESRDRVRDKDRERDDRKRDRDRKKKRRHSSDYSRSRSESGKKKQKKKSSKSRGKKHSKNKKSRKERDRSRSGSN